MTDDFSVFIFVRLPLKKQFNLCPIREILKYTQLISGMTIY